MDAASANTGAARSAYLQNKHNNYTSQAKLLLYGGDETAGAPQHHGKRSVPHAGQYNAAPFATIENGQQPGGVQAVQGGQVAKTYQARNAKKEGAGKISSTQHDADAYKAQLVANASNMATQKGKARGSAGLLGQQQGAAVSGGGGAPVLTHHHPDAPYREGEGYEGDQDYLPEAPEHQYRY